VPGHSRRQPRRADLPGAVVDEFTVIHTVAIGGPQKSVEIVLVETDRGLEKKNWRPAAAQDERE